LYWIYPLAGIDIHPKNVKITLFMGYGMNRAKILPLQNVPTDQIW
jgi:hypothetical protein